MPNTIKAGALAEGYSKVFNGNCACGFMPGRFSGEYFLREKRQTFK